MEEIKKDESGTYKLKFMTMMILRPSSIRK